MWQPTWSPHPPPGAHGAPLGQPAGTVAPPPQGVQPHAMVVAQPMNQQWMGNPTGSQGCPGNSPTLGSSPFCGPGPPGQGFVVQCKHHQGSYSIMQHQQPMLGTTSSCPPPPMGFGLGSQQAGYQGTTWSSFPTSTPLPQQVPQHQLDTSSNPQGHNPGTLPSPSPQPPSFTNFPPQPNQSFQHQPRPCLQTNIPVATSPLAQNLQGVQGQPALLGAPGQPALQAPPPPQGSPGLQSAHGPPVCQVSQVAQGQQSTRAPQVAQDPTHCAPTQQGIPQAQTSGNQPTNLVPPDFDTFGTTPGSHLGKKHRVTEIGSYTYTYTYSIGPSTFGNFSIFVLPKTFHSNTNYSSHCHTSQSKTTHTTNGTSSTSCTTQTQPESSFDQGKKFLKKIEIKVQEEKKIQI